VVVLSHLYYIVTITTIIINYLLFVYMYINLLIAIEFNYYILYVLLSPSMTIALLLHVYMYVQFIMLNTNNVRIESLSNLRV